MNGELNVPAPNTEFVAIAGGEEHSLGLKADGSIVAWGSNSNGQTNVPAPNTGFVAVAAGSYHSLGLNSDGSIVAWGINDFGQTDVPTPNTGFVGVAAGAFHSLGLKTDGSLVAWGAGETNPGFFPDFGQSIIPTPNTGFVGVAAGYYHTLGLKADGTIVAWGDNGEGQTTVPAPNTGFVGVAAGAVHSLGLKGDGSIRAWGWNDSNQTNIPAPNTGFVGVAAGWFHSLGLKADGSIIGWGGNNFGEINVPAPNTGFIAIAAGLHHSLGIRPAEADAVAACCHDSQCENLTEAQCSLHNPSEWQVGELCGVNAQWCPLDVCIDRTGSCFAQHSTPACDDSRCCSDVCFQDSFCCNVEWDQACVDEAELVCTPPCVAEQELTGMDSAFDDRFGTSVSVSGDTAVVGAPSDDDAGSISGSAYVFVRSGGTWTQQQKLTALDAAAGDLFGNSVSISGDTVLIGAWRDDAPSGDSGSAYVFVRSGRVWSQQAKLIASDGTAGDQFGYSVSVDGDTAVIGAESDGAPGTQSGSAYIFVRTGSVWTQQQKLTASDAGVSDRFGVSVSVSGNTALVGSFSDDSPLETAGSAYVFVRSGTVWTQQQKLTAPDAAEFDSFGAPVSLSGDTALIGVGNDDDAGVNSGSAHVFVRTGSIWSHQQKLTASDAAANDGFGSGQVSGDTVLIGASQDDHAGGSNAGSAYLFRRSGSVWTEERKLTASNAAGTDWFGGPVSLSGETAVVGATLTDRACPSNSSCNSGSAYIFDLGCPIEPLAPMPDPSGISKGRTVSIVPPAPAVAAMGGASSAIRVTLTSLHHVSPPYSGGLATDFSSFEGQVRWVGPPVQYVESTAGGAAFYASHVQCTPHYQDWSTVGLLHVTGSAIVPSSVYEVENVAASCMGIEASCAAVSEPLTIATARWADVESPYNPPSSTVQPDLADVSALVNKFRNAPGAPIKARALLVGGDIFGEIDIATEFSFIHIAACVDAFRGRPYPHTIAACP